MKYPLNCPEDVCLVRPMHGSLRSGCVWESIAIPELRGQAETAVRELLAIPAP